MSDFLSPWFSLGRIFVAVGLVFLFDGVVQLCVRKKTGLWKEGGATLLAGAIIVAVSVHLSAHYRLHCWLNSWFLLIAGLVLAVNGVAQLCVRKKTGSWKEGGATLLAGAIIVGVSVFGLQLHGLGCIWWFLGYLLVVGLVLLFNGVLQICVRKKKGLWKEGGASLLAGAIIAGGCWGSVYFTGILSLLSGWLFLGLIISGLVLAFNGVVQLCVRQKTGSWKEGGASLLAGAGVLLGVLIRLGWLWL